jgi:hypothetical protein
MGGTEVRSIPPLSPKSLTSPRPLRPLLWIIFSRTAAESAEAKTTQSRPARGRTSDGPPPRGRPVGCLPSERGSAAGAASYRKALGIGPCRSWLLPATLWYALPSPWTHLVVGGPGGGEARSLGGSRIPPGMRPARLPIRDNEEAAAMTLESGCEQGHREPRQDPAGLSRPIWLGRGIARDRRIRGAGRPKPRRTGAFDHRLAPQSNRVGGQLIEHRVGDGDRPESPPDETVQDPRDLDRAGRRGGPGRSAIRPGAGRRTMRRAAPTVVIVRSIPAIAVGGCPRLTPAAPDANLAMDVRT